MTDNGLLIVAAIIVGCLTELVWLFFRTVIRKDGLVDNPVYLILVHWMVSSLFVYTVLYIAYRLYFNSYP